MVITNFIADDLPKELKRLRAAVETMRSDLDVLLERGELPDGGEHREVLEAYRMFADDRGWLHRLEEAVRTGLTAEAAVERVQSDTRARMLRISDPYLRERLHDLDDLANRLMHQLLGQDYAPARDRLPENAVLVARSMGPAALLEYDRRRLRGIILEEGGPNSHVAIVARALGIAAVGEIANATGIADPGDAIIVDGTTGDVHIRPTPDMEAAYVERVRLRARRQSQYLALRDKPCVTKCGAPITLMINAGLAVDLPHIEETGTAGIGLFRTELQFMVAATFPRAAEQFSLYRAVLDAAGERPVTFRTLDIGGDKVLPYMRNVVEENPALGWRAIRLGLDRPALLRSQIRALAARRRRARPQDHVPDDRRGRGVRRGEGAGRARAHPSAPPWPQTARARRCRQHGRGALAALPARRAARSRGFPVGRLQRSGAVLLCGRSRQCPRRRPLRPDLGAGPARAAGDRRQGARPQQAGRGLRRARVATDRSAGPGRDRLPLVLAVALRGRPGQGHAARSRRRQGARRWSSRCSMVRLRGVSVRDQLKEFATQQGLQR